MKTVLIIDDEEMIRDLLRRALTKLNHTVLVAEDGGRGVAIFKERSEEIDMVIVDMLMPDMNGTEMILRIKELEPNIVTVLSSGQGESEIQAAVKDVGANGYILKPFRMSQLAETIEAVFGAIKISSHR